METRTKSDGISFKDWLAAVDAHLISKVGLSHSDLADFNSFDAWDSDMTPAEGAEECMASDDLYCDFDGDDVDLADAWEL